ncbi:hypothetical protein CGCTS75_v012835 [Colletotrichum tropicale]|nr:hypothetical protein CGCTS75_v012835 [Colletotrichum tropicale]
MPGHLLAHPQSLFSSRAYLHPTRHLLQIPELEPIEQFRQAVDFPAVLHIDYGASISRKRHFRCSGYQRGNITRSFKRPLVEK